MFVLKKSNIAITFTTDENKLIRSDCVSNEKKAEKDNENKTRIQLKGNRRFSDSDGS